MLILERIFACGLDFANTFVTNAYIGSTYYLSGSKLENGGQTTDIAVAIGIL